MPGYDMTGPEGKGKKTGRGLGICGTDDSKKLEDFSFGRGLGFRRGGGRRRMPLVRNKS